MYELGTKDSGNDGAEKMVGRERIVEISAENFTRLLNGRIELLQRIE